MAETEMAEAQQHEQELQQKATEVKATLEQRKAERKDIAAKNRQARCADPGVVPWACEAHHAATHGSSPSKHCIARNTMRI